MSKNPEAPFLKGGGDLGALMRAHDWSRTPLGPVSAWPESLRSALSICLGSRFPIAIYWGESLSLLYNDAWRPIPGGKHPWALGRGAREVWPEIWDTIGPLFEQVMSRGESTYTEDGFLPMHRHGYTEECYFNFTFTPIRGAGGQVEGVFNAVIETTFRVIGERRTRVLRDLGERLAPAKSAREACEFAVAALGAAAEDVAFCAIYGHDAASRESRLVAAHGLPPGAAPAWPFAAAPAAGVQVLDDLARRFGALPGGRWPEPAASAMLAPIQGGATGVAGFLVVGASPRRAVDEEYCRFVESAAAHVGKIVSNAVALEAERKRAEALAELDRAKTAFFSNVSHEFRTPLTLMLGPIEDILAKPKEGVLPENRAVLEVVSRNGQRLLKLVNTLLDFARIEAGRAQASYEPTDLAALTGELAANFRSACERAGLALEVDCPPAAEPAWVDREMWEKIVLNLVSNAFKFTFEGVIGVSLKETARRFELAVRDTGTGIPEAELPRLFERFHRVEGARGRSHEGSGIGLALVQELVKLHGGAIAVESAPGKGSTVTVSIPKGAAHLPAERLKAARAGASTALRAVSYVDEALSWLPQAHEDGSRGAAPQGRPRILLADDNADLREYARRLLAEQYEVETVADGRAALGASRARRPDLVLSDVMMPGLDGFGLLRELRADPELRTVPVLLLSARAGEEARIEGLDRGADDYLVKPFSARELLVRVATLLQSRTIRREAEAALRESEARYRGIFEGAAVAIWEEDFSAVVAALEGLRAAGVTDWRAYFAAHPEFVREAIGLVRVTDVNPAALRLYGARDRAALVASLAEVMLPESEAVFVEELVALAEGRGRFEADAAQRALDGRRLEVLLSIAFPPPGGDFRRVLVTLVDITERKRAERVVRESEARTRAMFESALDCIVSMDAAGRIVEFNPAAERTFGYARGAVLGRELAEVLIPPALRERHRQGLARHLAQGEATVLGRRIEMPALRADGTQILVELSVTRVPTEGAPLFSAYLRDITEQRRAAESLREADRAKDEFLATLSHELRNPLAPLRNALHVLREARSDPARLGPLHDMMARQVGHLVRLVDDLMEMSRITRGALELRKEPMALQAALRNALETSQPLIDAAGHRLSVSLPEEALTLEADPVRLAQVFSNLLNNAARYTPRGGAIALEARREDAQAVVSVSDTGEGLDAEQLERLFEMFHQGRRARQSQQGLGIGLALARRLTQMHGGTLHAQSEGRGKGSRFTVRLPLAHGRRPAAEAPQQPPARVAPKRVLVVDDNRDAADSLALLLQFLGADVQTAHDGPAALAAFDAYRPSVVLLDLGMPGMDGFAVARELRARLKNGARVPLVALTGWGQEEDRARSRSAGFDHHLVKPADIEALRALLGGV